MYQTNQMDKVKRKGTTATEALIGSGATRIEGAVKNLKEALALTDQLPTNLSLLSAQIAEKEDRLTELDVKFAEVKRAKEVQLQLDFRASETQVVNKWLSENQMVSILNSEYASMKNEVATLRSDQAAAVSKEVAIVSNSMKTRYEADMKVRESEYNAKEATNIATINSQRIQIDSLTKEIDSWKKQLDDERKASVDRAKASAVGAINVAPASR